LVEMKKAEYVIGDQVGIFFYRPIPWTIKLLLNSWRRILKTMDGT
jgi:hypothetical protein